MSISDKILNVYAGVGEAFSAANSRYAEMPAKYNLATLPLAIRSIPEVVSIDGEKDVNYYDYDGRLLYSFTAEEFLELEEHPINPYHAGLIAQGWNWNFSDAQDYVSSHGYVDIGQMYITDDGATRIYIHVRSDADKYIRSLRFSQNVANGVTVDWGDGSEYETYSLVDTSGGQWLDGHFPAPHIYETLGDYCIRLIPADNCTLTLYGSPNILSFYQDAYPGNTPNVYKIEVGRVANTITRSFNLLPLDEGITLPNNIEKLDSCFCYSQVKFVVLPSSLTTIASSLFQHAFYVRPVFPNSITAISQSAFKGITLSKVLPILDKVKNLDLDSVFNACSMKRHIVVKNTSATTLGSSFFLGPNYTNKGIEVDLSGCTNLTTIKPSCFERCYFKKVILPESITTIGNSAFAYSLPTEVNIPETVTSIGTSAFIETLNDSTLNVSLPNLTVLSNDVFMRCKFNSLSIPNVTTIGNQACRCASITSVNMPKVETIGTYAFYANNITALESMPNLTTVGASAFEGCVLLNSTLDAPNITTIGQHAFCRCHLKGVLRLPKLTALTTGTSASDAFTDCDFTEIADLGSISAIPNGRSNQFGCFAYMRYLTTVNLPDTLTTIGNFAFRNCPNLRTIEIPSGVTSIGTDAFHYTGLEHIDIPAGVTTIGNYAFCSVPNMEYVIIRNTTPPTVGAQTFGYNHGSSLNTYPIYVPYGCAEAYKAATNWSVSYVVNRIVELTEDGEIPNAK